MKRHSIASLVVGLGVIMLLGQACNNSQAQSPMVKRIDNTEMQALLKQEDIQLIDVRTPQEYAQGHLTGSYLINFMDPSFRERIDLLDHDKPVIVYCAAGGRSQKASEALKSAGFKKIYDLKDGYNGWAAAGLPVE